MSNVKLLTKRVVDFESLVGFKALMSNVKLGWKRWR